MKNPFNWIDEKLKKRYRHNEQMYRFMKGSILYWSVILISFASILLRNCR